MGMKRVTVEVQLIMEEDSNYQDADNIVAAGLDHLNAADELPGVAMWEVTYKSDEEADE